MISLGEIYRKKMYDSRNSKKKGVKKNGKDN